MYQANLPAGSLHAGQARITGSGGHAVGRFQASTMLGQDLKILSQFPAGATVSIGNPLNVTWTGGDPASVVTVRLVAHSFLEDLSLTVQAPASDGIATFATVLMCPGMGLPCRNLLDFPAASDVEIDIDVEPDPSQTPTFTALGLALGGRINWKYQYRFTGLTTQ